MLLPPSPAKDSERNHNQQSERAYGQQLTGTWSAARIHAQIADWRCKT
jgi:hypothetical protein